MKMRQLTSQGFTLVELLVAMAIIGILGGLAIKAYDVYKLNAYDAIADGAYTQTRAALEAGKIDSETFPNQVMISTTTGPGAPTGAEGPLLLPGLIVPKDVRVYVFHQPGCAGPLCVEDVITVRHCLSPRAISYTHLKGGGQALVRNAVAGAPC